jgi:hypothetical protein
MKCGGHAIKDEFHYKSYGMGKESNPPFILRTSPFNFEALLARLYV